MPEAVSKSSSSARRACKRRPAAFLRVCSSKRRRTAPATKPTTSSADATANQTQHAARAKTRPTRQPHRTSVDGVWVAILRQPAGDAVPAVRAGGVAATRASARASTCRAVPAMGAVLPTAAAGGEQERVAPQCRPPFVAACCAAATGRLRSRRCAGLRRAHAPPPPPAAVTRSSRCRLRLEHPKAHGLAHRTRSAWCRPSARIRRAAYVDVASVDGGCSCPTSPVTGQREHRPIGAPASSPESFSRLQLHAVRVVRGR